MREGDDLRGSGRLALVGVLALAAAVRLAAVAVLAPPKLHGDEGFYVRAARQLAKGAGFPGSERPPGFPAFLAAVFSAIHPSLTAARLVQVVVSTLAVALVFALVRRRHGVRAAVLSSLVVALHPTLAHYTALLWTETLFATLLLVVLWALDRWAADAERPGRPAWLVLAGATLGAAILVREMVLYLAPVVAAWAAWQGARLPRTAGGTHSARSAAARAALVLVPVAVVVLPWTARNRVVQGRWILVSTTRWMPVALGNLLPGPGRSLLDASPDDWFLPAYKAIPDEMEREEFARRVALDSIRAEQPWWIVEKVVRNAYFVYTPDGQLARYVRRDWLDARGDRVARVLVPIEQAYYVAAMALGIAAIWLVRGSPTKPIVVAIVLLHLAIYTFANANHRFRFPLLPLLALDVGPLLAGYVAADARRLRAAGAALTLAAFAAVVVTFYAWGETLTAPTSLDAADAPTEINAAPAP